MFFKLRFDHTKVLYFGLIFIEINPSKQIKALIFNALVNDT